MLWTGTPPLWRSTRAPTLGVKRGGGEVGERLGLEALFARLGPFGRGSEVLGGKGYCSYGGQERRRVLASASATLLERRERAATVRWQRSVKKKSRKLNYCRDGDGGERQVGTGNMVYKRALEPNLRFLLPNNVTTCGNYGATHLSLALVRVSWLRVPS